MNPSAKGNQDSGIAVKMFESPTLDRFLRKAQEFLDRDDFGGAIQVLQDVLEGRIEPGARLEGSDEDPPPADPVDAAPEDDPTHAVFSSDERLYRPVRRLCQEKLARLPGPGQVLYREMFEVAAARDYETALARFDVRGLEAIYNRYFATYSAARAMYSAGDLLMHQGRFRAAIQTFRNLLHVYPDELRAEIAGLSDVYARIKIALCFLEMGERAAAGEILAELEQVDTGVSVRLQGELVGVGQLRESELFSGAAQSDRPHSTRETPVVLRSLPTSLLPVWEHRFAELQPYRRPSGSRGRNLQVSGSAPAAPSHSQFSPGTSARFVDGRLAFLDHFRLRIHDVCSGMLQSESDGALVPPPPRQGHARVRVPVYDWAASRVAFDDERYYCIRGPGRPASGVLDPILKNGLIAYDRGTLRPLWSSLDRVARDTPRETFLATPTVFGRRLIGPVLVGGAYALQALDGLTGEVLYRVHLHAGGSEFARAPSAPAVVELGIVYVLTNAGAIAAVDAYTGELNWVRRYERTHPLRPARRRRAGSRTRNAMQRTFRESRLTSFAPSELAVIEGRVIFAPVDGDVLICLDGASGELLWVISRPNSRQVYLLGHNSRFLYLCGERSMMCVDHRTGVRLWEVDTPTGQWEGRGLVSEQVILLPGDRAIYGRAADGSGGWRRVDLPKFFVGREPLTRPANLFASGPHVVVSHAGGVEVFASPEALQELASAATDLERRAALLVQAGDLVAAIEILGPLAADESRTAAERDATARRVLALARDVVLARAAHGAAAGAAQRARDDALALMDRCRAWLTQRDLLLRWQLLRIELFRELGERDAVEREQDVLYAMMEGRR